MNPIKKQMVLDKNEYYIKHLRIINNFLPEELAPKEIEVLAAFMALEGDIAMDRFGTSARKIVMQQTNISPGGLGNYLKSFKEKNFVKKDSNGSLTILPILYPDSIEQGYMFKLRRNDI